jgi:Protein of unknown function (DUF3572)
MVTFPARNGAQLPFRVPYMDLIDETQRTPETTRTQTGRHRMIREDRNIRDAEDIAISALSWLVRDESLLRRFLDLSGIEASDIRTAAAEPGFFAGVLKFIAAHEPTLNAFAAAETIHPSAVMKAIRALPGGSDDWMG